MVNITSFVGQPQYVCDCKKAKDYEEVDHNFH